MTETIPNEDFLLAMLEAEEQTMSVVITNPSLGDNAIIHVSEEFADQTGYSPEEVLGRNCRFLQGPETDPETVEAIRVGLKAQITFTIDILNYRKSGEPFMNRLRIRPLFDETGELTYYVGAQNPVRG